ncbi:LacI family DNA-binding transcriptional regulator [Leucobacter musarum]|uniref:LacI family DNA-binding transcriptional regulator n=1 Tax=Leucobacter musarum TaxID=1930747 RepID=UPI00138F84D4|nr:LacI family DNA-binding transcriptional regulator [Leucobacter musarum]
MSTPEPASRPTMRDVAERVGMSRQLVSIVLRGAPGASEASRERILAAAREIGYHPDDSARMLRRRRSGQLGVLFTMRQPFEVDLVDALYRHAAQLGYTLALGTMGEHRDLEPALAGLMRQRIEALIVLDSGAGIDGSMSSRTNVLTDLPPGIPTLLLGGPTSPEPHDRVDVENERGIALAVEHLIALGHTRIAYVGSEVGANAAPRLAGFHGAMAAHGLPAQVVASDYTELGGHRAALGLLADGRIRAGAGSAPSHSTESVTALVCMNDHSAIGALQTLVRAGVRIPEDVSIVGFDDSSAAALPYIDLTSVRPDPDRMAQLAVETVHARLAEPGARTVTRHVIPTLTKRASTAAPRA